MVARMYQELLEVRLKQLVNLIEPSLIIFLGGIVAFVASAMICAIISSYGRLAG
jgi:type II secretory pathway component PulF